MKRLGATILPSRIIQRREVVEGLAHVGMVGPQDFLADGKGAQDHRNRGVVLAGIVQSERLMVEPPGLPQLARNGAARRLRQNPPRRAEPRGHPEHDGQAHLPPRAAPPASHRPPPACSPNHHGAGSTNSTRSSGEAISTPDTRGQDAPQAPIREPGRTASGQLRAVPAPGRAATVSGNSPQSPRPASVEARQRRLCVLRVLCAKSPAPSGPAKQDGDRARSASPRPPAAPKNPRSGDLQPLDPHSLVEPVRLAEPGVLGPQAAGKARLNSA
jgi:hypothetical protein